MSFQLYRQTMMGDCLVEALEEMIEQEKLPADLAQSIVTQFDQSMLEALRTHVTGRAHIKANLKHYRYFDNVWQFTLENVTFRLSPSGGGSLNTAHEISCDRAKVVCVDSKLVDETIEAITGPDPAQPAPEQKP
uniref:Transcription initiation factor IIA subunit 2 n=1 Tax=Dunaliella tertiolecta TaxID=3047 RepID=A0A7S3VTU2_DUNTE|mmetsp:Transcript_21069/g.58521  ORF Transcript_21069/g.58521 Transcript_21069/m.58521 type:complete len:134 (-) Transcript_21069:529-930(-)